MLLLYDTNASSSSLKSHHIVLKVSGVPLLFQAPHCLKNALEILTGNLCPNSKGHLLCDGVSEYSSC